MQPFVAYHDKSSDAHQASVDDLSPKGYRPVVLNVSGGVGDPRYAAVWVQRPGPAWRAIHDVPEAQYQARFDEIVGQGFVPEVVTATGPDGSAVFAATFVAAGRRWFARHALRWGADGDPQTINNSMARAFSEGFVPRSVAVYGTAQDPRFAGVWTHNDGTGWAWYWGDYGFHQRTFDAQLLGGQHPSQVAVGSGMLLSVYTDDHLGRWSARHDMTAHDYQLAFNGAVAEGLRPITVQAGDLRYAATFAADDVPLPRRWRVDGPAIPGGADLDTVLSSVMKRFGIRAASVAAARNGTTYLKRAYTWAEDDWPTATTSTTFRIASVSKTFTCAAVQALADDGVINLDARVFAYLGLTSNVPHDPRADMITIRQCATGQSGLPHDFGATAATFRDISVALGHHASIRELAAHIYTVPLAFNPGPPPAGVDGYSNSAFHVLGALVEQASGQRFVDFVNRRLARPMGISAPGRRPPAGGSRGRWSATRPPASDPRSST